jgi:hypothetical protein
VIAPGSFFMELVEIPTSKRGLDAIRLATEVNQFEFNQRSAAQRVEMILQAEFEDSAALGNA